MQNISGRQWLSRCYVSVAKADKREMSFSYIIDDHDVPTYGRYPLSSLAAVLQSGSEGNQTWYFVYNFEVKTIHCAIVVLETRKKKK